MAHGPSPFGVPQQTQGRRDQTDPGIDWPEYDERARMHATTARLGPESLAPASTGHTPEADLEAQLEHLHASRPLRRAAQKARRRTKWWLVALAIVSALAVAAACAAGAFIVMRGGDPDAGADIAPTEGEQQSSVEDASGAPEVVDPIAARETDAEPISVAELFGAEAITPAGAAGPYAVLDSEELADCAEAGLDELADLLADSGCTQTVRATVVSPDGEFAATAGVLNLADADEAEAMREAIDAGLEGGFAALRTDGEAAELGRAATMVGYNTYGHYLMYVVIGRTDGEAIEDAGDEVRTIVGDLVDVWFVDQLKPRRDVQ
ncbi:hypothetical protein [Glycomyces sp. NRRL B-16210]|uniref:hypothetical protein n=1 Tax=Glycomyces sp. NRRL B-16210 TaxID=1463821 RepID=UPI0004BEFD05|nr:hypothetical protein [Glycomyces sp. NRRL B-16210]